MDNFDSPYIIDRSEFRSLVSGELRFHPKTITLSSLA